MRAHFRDDVRVSSPEEPVERDVLSSLPRTRPQRRSAKRDGGGAKPKRAAPRRPPAKATPRPAAKAKAKAKTASGPAKPRSTAQAPRPQPASRPSDPPRSVEPPSRTDVLAGAAEAAGELVRAGLAVGNELVRVALRRLPRP
jgi:hypothetical protein